MLVLCRKLRKLCFGCCFHRVKKTATNEGRGNRKVQLLPPSQMKTKIDKRDYKFIPEKPDVNFSPEHNKRVIERTIAKYEKTRREKMKLFREGLGERSEAVASFWHHVNMGRHNDIERYFGPSMLAKLRGADILDELRNKLNVITKPSPIYVQGGVVKTIKGDIVGKEVSNATKKQKRQENPL